jgi:hypothetical protein
MRTAIGLKSNPCSHGGGFVDMTCRERSWRVCVSDGNTGRKEYRTKRRRRQMENLLLKRKVRRISWKKIGSELGG